MAREVIEKLVDDLDGGDAAETVTFALVGTSYEIDVSKKNAGSVPQVAGSVRQSGPAHLDSRCGATQGGRFDERVEAEARVRHHATAGVGRRERVTVPSRRRI